MVDILNLEHSVILIPACLISVILVWKRERAVQGMDMFLRVVTSIPGIDDHDANAVTSLYP